MNRSSSDDFEAALRRDAALIRQRTPPSPQLASDILHAVHRERARAARAHVQPAARWIAWPFCAAAAALTFALMTLPPDSNTVNPAIISSAPSEIALATRPADWWRNVEPDAQAWLAASPLESEVNALVSDGRNALRFLALNFLPGAPEAEGPGNG